MRHLIFAYIYCLNVEVVKQDANHGSTPSVSKYEACMYILKLKHCNFLTIISLII